MPETKEQNSFIKVTKSKEQDELIFYFFWFTFTLSHTVLGATLAYCSGRG